MLGVILDQGSIGADISYAALLDQLDQWQCYSNAAEDEVVERISSASVVVTNKVYLGHEVLKQAPLLRLVCVSATGTNNIDIEAAHRLGITVSNVRGYATASVVEHTFSLILSLSRNLKAYQHDVAQGAWQQSKHFCLLNHPISELSGKKLGIIGYGELGQAVARVGTVFGMEVLIAESLRGDALKSEDRIALDELLAQVDVLSLHCPLTDETQGLIDKQKIDLMKPSAMIINTARGGIVDEEALCDALLSGGIAGAAVDVLEQEPPLPGSKLLSVSLPNLLVTPHIAWASKESRQRLLKEVSLNVAAFLRGEPRNLV